MAAWTLEEAQDKLNEWLDAESRIAKGQSLADGDKSIRYADASEITRKISFWRNEVDRLEKSAAGKSPFQNIRTRFV